MVSFHESLPEFPEFTHSTNSFRLIARFNSNKPERGEIIFCIAYNRCSLSVAEHLSQNELTGDKWIFRFFQSSSIICKAFIYTVSYGLDQS